MDSRLSFPLRGKNSLAGLQGAQGCSPAGREAPLLSLLFSPFYPAGPKAGFLQSCTCHCCHGETVGDRGQGTESQLLSCFTLQQLTTRFFSPEPDPTSCKQHAKKTLKLLAKKRGFPSQAGERREINPVAKNSKIRKRSRNLKQAFANIQNNYRCPAGMLLSKSEGRDAARSCLHMPCFGARFTAVRALAA